MEKPGSGRPGGNPIFKGKSNPSPPSRGKYEHPIWPGTDKDKLISITLPKLVYLGLTSKVNRAKSKRQTPGWVKHLVQSLLWEIFLEIHDFQPEDIFCSEKGFLIENEFEGSNNLDYEIEKVSIKRRGQKKGHLTITMDLKEVEHGDRNRNCQEKTP